MQIDVTDIESKEVHICLTHDDVKMLKRKGEIFGELDDDERRWFVKVSYEDCEEDEEEDSDREWRG